jgi:hypothetical protein
MVKARIRRKRVAVPRFAPVRRPASYVEETNTAPAVLRPSTCTIAVGIPSSKPAAALSFMDV